MLELYMVILGMFSLAVLTICLAIKYCDMDTVVCDSDLGVVVIYDN